MYNTATRNLVKVLGGVELEAKRGAWEMFRMVGGGANTPTARLSVCTPKSWNYENSKGRNSSIGNFVDTFYVAFEMQSVYFLI